MASGCDTLNELKGQAKACANLDELVLLLGDNLDLLGDRPEEEGNIMWIPTFGGEPAGDGGDGWEVVSWDADRIATMHRLYGGPNRFELSVRDRD
jgi:hypothetical protein